MAKIRFLLKKPQHRVKDKELTLILFIYRLSTREKIVRSIDESVHPDDWDFIAQQPRKIKNRADLNELRYKIVSIEQHMTAIFRKIDNDGMEITARIINEELDKFLRIDSKSEGNIKEYALKVYARNKTEKNYIHIRSAMARLESFYPNITFSKLNGKLFDDYISFLLSKNYRKNTINNYINTLNTVLRDAISNGKHHVDPVFMKKIGSGYYSNEKIKRVALTVDELKKVYHYLHVNTLTEVEKQVVESFLVMAFTGIRLKDASLSNLVNFEHGYYTRQTSKTMQRVRIPLHYIVKEIIQRSGGFKFPTVANNTYINILRRILRDAGIDGSITFTVTIGGEKVEFVKKKYECVSAHTGRRSFATNIHKAGIPPAVAMVFTGHKTIQQYMDYIMVYEDEMAEEYISHPFFESNDK